MYKIRLIYNKKDFTAKLKISREGAFAKIFKFGVKKMHTKWHISEIFRWRIDYHLPFVVQNKGICYNEKENVLILNASRMNEKINREVLCKIVVKNIKEIDIHKDPRGEGVDIGIAFNITDVAEGVMSFFSLACDEEFWISIKSFPLYLLQEDIYEQE